LRHALTCLKATEIRGTRDRLKGGKKKKKTLKVLGNRPLKLKDTSMRREDFPDQTHQKGNPKGGVWGKPAGRKRRG